jgi:hypothetical protein
MSPLRYFCLLLLTVVTISFVAPPVVLADNSNIPHSLFDMRDRLLKERQDLLADRSDYNSRLNYLDGYRIQIDKALSGNPWNRDALIDARNGLVKRMDDITSWLESTERNLLANDKDLALIESEMQRYACIN